MPELKLKQIEYEYNTWKRTLEYLIDENIHLKNRLSEILKNRFDKYLLEEVDDFQNRFIQEDQLVSLIRHDIVELNKLFDREIFEKEKLKPEIDKKIRKIRHNLMAAERQFGELKLDFNNFLSENIL
ncbi:MAG: hypothetical protein IPL84_12335 [Chitinophagaceae bacterium]|nr:hypothetical protein [Chitinophagaceae bacterium]